MTDYKTGGYEKRYVVMKADGSSIDDNADYFVLRLDTDEHARKAIAFYANSIKSENEQLFKDLINRLEILYEIYDWEKYKIKE